MYRVNHSGRTSVMPFTFFSSAEPFCFVEDPLTTVDHSCVYIHTRSLATPLICMRAPFWAYTTFVDVSAAAAVTMNTSEVVQWPQRENCTIDEHMFPKNDTIQDKRMHSATLTLTCTHKYIEVDNMLQAKPYTHRNETWQHKEWQRVWNWFICFERLSLLLCMCSSHDRRWLIYLLTVFAKREKENETATAPSA